MNKLSESSLSRVWRHYQDPDTQIGILTAFRGEYDHETNLRRNRALAADIREQGLGFFFLDGFWIENQGTPEERKVKEDSLFVIGKSKQGFAELIHRLGNKYEQEAVVAKDENGTRLIFKDGSDMPLGELRPGRMGDIYSKLRGGSSGTFVFESERDDLGWISRLAGIQR